MASNVLATSAFLGKGTTGCSLFQIEYVEMGDYETKTITFTEKPTIVIVLLECEDDSCAILTDGKSTDFGAHSSNSYKTKASLSGKTLSIETGAIPEELCYMAFG